MDGFLASGLGNRTDSICMVWYTRV